MWIVTVYLILVMCVGFRSRSHIYDIDNFFFAGRNVCFFQTTCAIFTTWYGSGALLGVVTSVYKNGIRYVIADPIATPLGSYFQGFF